jgi:Tfp pilus assembly PilM family ATPase
MPRILAIDWDRLEARALLMHAGPTGSSIVGAWTASLALADGVSPTPRDVGARLSAVIGGAAGANATTLVGVGRDQVQMVLLTLPPAPPDELPDLVRFQAERELTSLGAEAALDYIPLAGDATTPHQVLAAALSASGITEVRQLCEAVGVEPARITLRATAAASYVSRRLGAQINDVTLVVNRLTDEADLTVLVGDQPVLVRTVRLPVPTEIAGRARALAGEIRRTIAAVRQQLGERQVSRVVLCGIATEAGSAATLATDLGIAVEVFDVAEHAPSGLAKTGLSLESIARFAALMGMALGEADRRAPIVDFLNVRRRVTERKFTRQHMLAVAAASLAVAFFGLLLWKRSNDLTAELTRINNEIVAKQNEFKELQFEKTLAEAESVERWLATDVNWLDELDRFSNRWRPEPLDSKKYPVAEDAIVTQLTAFRPAGNDVVGGRVTLQGVVRNQAAVAALQQRLADLEHMVDAGNFAPDSSVPGYTRSFNLTVDVVPPVEDAP